MLVDGKYIAHTVKEKVKDRTYEIDPHLSLGIIVTQENPAIKKFVELKKEFGKSVHVEVEELTLGVRDQTNEKLLELMMHSARKFDGLVLQLPLGHQYNLEDVLNIYPMTHDVDVLGNMAYEQFREGNLPFLPPVVGAFSEILKANEVKLVGKKVLVVGEGRLVGAPAAIWARGHGAYVTVATKETADITPLTQDADIIMLGAGSPGLLKPDMIKEGVIILDAGTGEVAGVLQGDADPACAEKASLFTPTPGGIGPITVAKVFENLVALKDIKTPKREVIAY